MTTYSGPYEKIDSWIGDHQHVPAGAPWESYITAPGSVTDPADWKTEIFWPVKPVNA